MTSASVAPALRPSSWSASHLRHVVPLRLAGFPQAQVSIGSGRLLAVYFFNSWAGLIIEEETYLGMGSGAVKYRDLAGKTDHIPVFRSVNCASCSGPSGREGSTLGAKLERRLAGRKPIDGDRVYFSSESNLRPTL